MVYTCPWHSETSRRILPVTLKWRCLTNRTSPNRCFATADKWRRESASVDTRTSLGGQRTTKSLINRVSGETDKTASNRAQRWHGVFFGLTFFFFFLFFYRPITKYNIILGVCVYIIGHNIILTGSPDAYSRVDKVVVCYLSASFNIHHPYMVHMYT